MNSRDACVIRESDAVRETDYKLEVEVNPHGYCWLEARIPLPDIKAPGGEPFLAPGKELGRLWLEEAGHSFPDEYTKAVPSAEPALHRRFADLDGSADAILGFANQYGLLSDVEVELNAVTPEAMGRNPFTLHFGEPLDAWRNEIASMRAALSLWNLTRADDTVINQAMPFTPGEVGSMKAVIGNPDGPGFATELFLANELGYAPKGQQAELLPGPSHVYQSFDGHLFAGWELEADATVTADMSPRERVFVALATLTNAHLAHRIASLVEFDPAVHRTVLITLPNCLAGAIWLQFAQAMDARTDYRRCSECRQWFQVSPEVARADKSYCGDACRSRAYRRRRSGASLLEVHVGVLVRCREVASTSLECERVVDCDSREGRSSAGLTRRS
jgi:hypothetical protein